MNVPYEEFLNKDGGFKEVSQMERVFLDHGIDLTRRIVGSCQTGLSANVNLVAALLCGARDLSLYDGSFVEWARQPENPIKSSL